MLNTAMALYGSDYIATYPVLKGGIQPSMPERELLFIHLLTTALLFPGQILGGGV